MNTKIELNCYLPDTLIFIGLFIVLWVSWKWSRVWTMFTAAFVGSILWIGWIQLAVIGVVSSSIFNLVFIGCYTIMMFFVFLLFDISVIVTSILSLTMASLIWIFIMMWLMMCIIFVKLHICSEIVTVIVLAIIGLLLFIIAVLVIVIV